MKTRKLSENGASGANLFAPPSLEWRKGAENRLKFIDWRPVVRAFTQPGSNPAARPPPSERKESAHRRHPTSSRARCYRQQPAYRHALPQPRAATAKTTRLLDLP